MAPVIPGVEHSGEAPSPTSVPPTRRRRATQSPAVRQLSGVQPASAGATPPDLITQTIAAASRSNGGAALISAETLTGLLAHELLQPLTSVMVNADVARRLLSQPAPDIDGALSALDDVVLEDRRATEIIRHIRALLKRGPILESCNVRDVIEDATRVIRSDAARRRIEFSCDVADASMVCADHVLLRQVLVNLLRNAFDAVTVPKSASRKVSLRTRRSESGGTLIVVEDDGARVSDARFKRLGDALFTSKRSGLGLGLVLCRQILHAHGSELQVQRKGGGGMIFSFMLVPSRRSHPPLTGPAALQAGARPAVFKRMTVRRLGADSDRHCS